MSYFRFNIYKDIRKVLILPIFLLGLIKVLYFFLNETSIIKNWLPAHFIKTVSLKWF